MTASDHIEVSAIFHIQIVLSFTFCNFPIAVQFIPKLHSHPCGVFSITNSASIRYHHNILQCNNDNQVMDVKTNKPFVLNL